MLRRQITWAAVLAAIGGLISSSIISEVNAFDVMMDFRPEEEIQQHPLKMSSFLNLNRNMTIAENEGEDPTQEQLKISLVEAMISIARDEFKEARENVPGNLWDGMHGLIRPPHTKGFTGLAVMEGGNDVQIEKVLQKLQPRDAEHRELAKDNLWALSMTDSAIFTTKLFHLNVNQADHATAYIDVMLGRKKDEDSEFREITFANFQVDADVIKKYETYTSRKTKKFMGIKVKTITEHHTREVGSSSAEVNAINGHMTWTGYMEMYKTFMDPLHLIHDTLKDE